MFWQWNFTSSNFEMWKANLGIVVSVYISYTNKYFIRQKIWRHKLFCKTQDFKSFLRFCKSYPWNSSMFIFALIQRGLAMLYILKLITLKSFSKNWRFFLVKSLPPLTPSSWCLGSYWENNPLCRFFMVFINPLAILKWNGE